MATLGGGLCPAVDVFDWYGVDDHDLIDYVLVLGESVNAVTQHPLMAVLIIKSFIYHNQNKKYNHKKYASFSQIRVPKPGVTRLPNLNKLSQIWTIFSVLVL